MANAVYPIYKTAILSASANVSLTVDDATDGPFCALVDTGTYTYSAAHDFFNDLSGIVGTDQRITAPTVGSVAAGVFDGADLTYTAVSGASVEALIIYRHNSGANTTWRLVCYIDTSVTGLPVTPNGGNITVTWNASGILLISDRRLKENVSEIGVLNDRLPIYEFNYVGGEKRHVGLMAQDVEKVVPGAVIDLGRYKAVDYRQAVDSVMALAA
jgi:hypothetical protein